jgi:predicted CoA-binding protein
MVVEYPKNEEIKNLFRQIKRIAVVGLSNNPARTSYKVSEIMLKAGYEIIPINPVIDEVFGIKAIPSLNEVRGPVDIVNVFDGLSI